MNDAPYIDLQVNGMLGVDFSSASLTYDQIVHVTKLLAERGTYRYCPTIITSSMHVYRHVLPLLGRAVKDPLFGGALLGLHLEGPFINPAPGAVGAHRAELTASVDLEKFEQLWQLSGQTIKLLTLAPELDGAAELIAFACEKGIAVSVGHTLCDSRDVQRAVESGATLATHLGNGCPNTLDRHNNPIWAQLDSPLKLMLISDGEHLPVPLLRIFMRLRSDDEVIITSDMASVAGLAAGNYELAASSVKITPSGRIEDTNAPNLAGSAATLCQCADFLRENNLASEQQIRKFTHDNPLAAIGMYDG